MPVTRQDPEDRRESFSSSAPEPNAEGWQTYSPDPGVSRPTAADPHMGKALPEIASPSHEPLLDQEVMNQTAVKIGTLIGTAVNIFKGVQRQLRSTPDNVVSMRDRMRDRSRQIRQDAAGTVHEWRQTAQARAHEVRERTAEYVHENPFQVIAAVAGAAFFLGFALRIWRSRLD
jgi:ElaB/YqjD/DUF883 family membrane-anchored ribosome-binding protein